MKLLALFSVIFMTACGAAENKEAQCIFKGCPSTSSAPADQITSDQVAQLQNLGLQIRSWAPTCGGGIACEDGNDGDSLLWAGLLCSVGEQAQCNAVRSSQSSDGRAWRSPSRVNNASKTAYDADGDSNSFSRDMLLGFLHYLAATKDVAAGTNLVNYIISHDDKLCTDANDNRCDLTFPQYSEAWGTMKYVWLHMDATPTKEMEQGDIGDEAILKTESVFAINNGYTLHLVAVELYLRQRIGNFDSTLQNAAGVVLSRQPNNPFYEYVANGKTSRAADLVLQYCPTKKPSQANQWSWQRDTAEAAWNNSMGWDCIFAIDLLTQ